MSGGVVWMWVCFAEYFVVTPLDVESGSVDTISSGVCGWCLKVDCCTPQLLRDTLLTGCCRGCVLIVLCRDIQHHPWCLLAPSGQLTTPGMSVEGWYACTCSLIGCFFFGGSLIGCGQHTSL
jgi:hypothetical protein